MVNINFHQKNQQDESAKKKRMAINGSFFVSILILVISFSIFFGLKVFHNNVKNETASIKGQMNEELRSLGEEKISRTADFQKRTEEIESGISRNKNPKEIMSKVESLMTPGVVLTSYKYDSVKKTLALEAISDSFKKIAEQILSLKSSSYFEDVRVPKTTRDEEGRINFSVESRLVFETN
ncbi:PilN domain-containing protein [bacterium]|nr:PilN domain-containing protein [bacterium]